MSKSKIKLKSESEIKIMKEGGKVLSYILSLLAEKAMPGVWGDELEEIANREIKKHNAESSFKNYKISGNISPFPSATCLSLNDEIVHGFPFGKILKEGDIAGIDLGIKYEGFHTDSAITVGIGKISEEAKKLIEATQKSLYKGIEQARHGNNAGDIGFAIQSFVEKEGFSVVRDLVGHGVGNLIHEPPEIPNFGKKGEGFRLRSGMTFAIEPMINAGGREIKCDSDGWTIRTKDGSLSTHFEHTVAVTKTGCEILTE